MARNIPKSLATFVSSDTDTARLMANLQAAVQPLLDFNAKWFQAKGNALNVLGAVQSAGATLLNSFRSVPDGTVAAPGLAFAANQKVGLEREGAGTTEQLNVIFNGIKSLSLTRAGLALTPFDANAALLLLRNAAGSLMGTLNNAGTLNLPSFISQQGFKFALPQFYFWGNGGTTSTSFTFMSVPVVATIGTMTANYAVQAWTAPRAGSVTALSVYFDRSNTVAFNLRLQINGVQTATLLTNATGNTSVTFAKNTSGLTFAANQTIAVLYQTPTAGTPSAVLCASVEVEVGA